MKQKKTKVLFAWKVKPFLQSYFKKRLGSSVEVIFPKDRTFETLIKAVEDIDILVAWSLSKELLENAHRLKFLIIPAVGIDSFMSVLKEFPNIIVANSHGNSITTSQHAVALLLSLTNHIALFDKRMRQGRWKAFDDNPPSLFLNNLTIGILGMGNVGQGIRKLMTGFPVSFIGCSKSGRQISAFPNTKIYASNQLEKFLTYCNILIITLPLTEETRGLLGDTELSLLPEKALLVNVARGPIIEENTLFEFLSSGRLAGAALDVWYNYNPQPDNKGRSYPYSKPFHTLDNVILSPHRGGSPLSRPERYNDILDNIIRWTSGRPIINKINLNEGY